LFLSIEATYLWIAPNPSFARCIMGTTKSHKAPMISIVDDDKSFREATKRLMRSMGYGVSLFASAGGFLQSERGAHSSCLIVHMHMPGLSGTKIEQQPHPKSNRPPIIFISAPAHKKANAYA